MYTRNQSRRKRLRVERRNRVIRSARNHHPDFSPRRPNRATAPPSPSPFVREKKEKRRKKQKGGKETREEKNERGNRWPNEKTQRIIRYSDGRRIPREKSSRETLNACFTHVVYNEREISRIARHVHISLFAVTIYVHIYGERGRGETNIETYTLFYAITVGGFGYSQPRGLRAS